MTESNHPPMRTLDFFLESLPVMMWMTDTNLSVTWSGGGAIRILGLDQVFPAGSNIRELVGEDHALIALHQSALSSETREMEIEWMERAYHTRIQPLWDDRKEVIGCIGVAHDVTELRRAERTIMWQSSFDAVTGALNRTRLAERLQMLLVQAVRADQQVSVVVVDIDGFDAVNASLGNAGGDEVLRHLASQIASAAPAGTMVGRLGADDFAVILVDASSEEVRLFCDSIHDAFERPFEFAGKELHLSVSAGIASCPVDGRSAERLLRSAKAATRRAHQLGGRRSQTFFSALTLDSIQQMELDHDLRRALARDEFFLVYQPQIRLEDGAVEGLEVLLRWRKDGDVLPAWSFIPRLEESPLMIPVGNWIVDRALAQLKEWHEQGLNPGRLAINVGARQLNDDSFVSHVRRSLCLHGISPSLLDIEITETVAMQNVETSLRILEELREIGADITIDDFGTGYSSLNYLKRFTISGLKIDRSFVADLPDSRAGAAIVKAMIFTANALDLRLVAEGVEIESQAAWLREAGCSSAQGFLFSKPMAAEDVGAYLRSTQHH